MPAEYVIIKGTNPKKPETFGKNIKVRKYWYDDTLPCLGVIYGCFSPFTGKYGHGRLLSEAQKLGINDFIIVSPNKDQDIDDNRNMFTLEQKLKITREGCKELGFNVIDSYISKNKTYLPELMDIAEKYSNYRIVLICGPDRKDFYLQKCDAFDENKTVEHIPNEYNNFEVFALDTRGTKNVSGTLIRKLIKDNEKDEFLEMTGYTDKMWTLCRNFAKVNGVTLTEASSFKQHINEEMITTNRVGIKHLYNPGNSQQLPAIDFLNVLNTIKSDNSVLINGKNFELSEKADGWPFRFGLDDEGKFFIEQAYSGPLYTPQELKQKLNDRYKGKTTRLTVGWMHLLRDLAIDEKTQNVLNSIYNEFGSFKVICEALMTEVGYKDGKGGIQFICTNYSLNKIGTKCTLIMFDVINGEGKSIPEAKTILNLLINKASSKEIRFDDAIPEVDITLNLKTCTNEITKRLKELNNKFKTEFNKTLEEVLLDKSRVRIDQQNKKIAKQEVENCQGLLNNEINKQMTSYEGKWGSEFEGIVLKLKDGTSLKITSDRFKDVKKTHSSENVHQYLIEPMEDED